MGRSVGPNGEASNRSKSGPAWLPWTYRCAARLLRGDASTLAGLDRIERIDVIRCMAELLIEQDHGRRRGAA